MTVVKDEFPTNPRMEVLNALAVAKEKAVDSGMDHAAVVLQSVSDAISWGGVRSFKTLYAMWETGAELQEEFDKMPGGNA